MKYCLDYIKNKSPLMKKVNEITIYYNPTDTTLVDFLLLYKEKRINILIEDLEEFCETELSKIQAIKEKYPDLQIYLKIGSYNQELLDKIKETGFPFFIYRFANNWEVFNGLIDLGVSDIYVVESLGFELEACSKIAHNKGIQIRVFPNIAQSSWTNTEALKKFFIRPEDVKLYEPYVDVMEFITESEKAEVYYEVYAEKHQWFGPLNEIIRDLKSDIDNRYIVPRFAKNRINCGKRCQKGGHCRICESIEELANTLKEKEIVVVPKKTKIDKK